MAVSIIGKPFQGIIYYEVEATYGAGLAGGGIEKPISKYVQSVKIGSGDRHAIVRGFDSPSVASLIEQTEEPSISIEYLLQVGDSLLTDSVNRDTCCELSSLVFVVGLNNCISNATDDRSFFTVDGCKASSAKISSSKNEPYTITIDYEAQSVVTADGANQPGATPTALTGAICQFNTAGEITKAGGLLVDTDHIAFITNSVDITITNQLTPYTDHDSVLKSNLIEGELNIIGTVDITLDGGGALHFGEVMANTSFVITVNTGNAGSGAVKLTLDGCKWDNTEVEGNISGEAIMESASFTAIPSSCTDSVATVA